jgi:hypothetical protein
VYGVNLRKTYARNAVKIDDQTAQTHWKEEQRSSQNETARPVLG